MNLKSHTRHLGNLLIAAVGLGSVVAAGCSNNIEDGLYADSEAHISLSLSASGFQNGLLTIGSAQSATIFTVTSTTRWTVDVTDCEGAWCQITYGGGNSDEAGHIGDGTFTVEAAPNRSGSTRECNVTVYAIEADGTHIPGKSVEIHLTQDRQSILVDYGGDVISPYGTTQATEPTVTVTANQAWNVSTSHDWVTVIPGEGMDGMGFTPADGSTEERAVSFRLKVDGNPGTSARTTEVTISSPTSAFTPIRLNVTQEGSNETFFVTPSNVSEVSYSGATLDFQVYSPRESWTVRAVSAGDWLTVDTASGEASTEPVNIRLTVAPNEDIEREGALVFVRDGGMGETVITIRQSGNPESPSLPEPESIGAISEPWLVSGWNYNEVHLKACYVTRYTALSCGIEVVRKNSGGSHDDVSGELLPAENIAEYVLTGLEPNTEYTVYPYFVVETEFPYRWKITNTAGFTFRTPDRNGDPGQNDHTVPGVDDNTPPTVN